jgi:hypothetical protein
MLINEVGCNGTVLELINARVSNIASSAIKLVCPGYFFICVGEQEFTS